MVHDPTASESIPLSIEEFERLPDDEWRSELVRGVVVREPPAGFEHGRVAMRVSFLLARFVEERGLGGPDIHVFEQGH